MNINQQIDSLVDDLGILRDFIEYTEEEYKNFKREDSLKNLVKLYHCFDTLYNMINEVRERMMAFGGDSPKGY